MLDLDDIPPAIEAYVAGVAAVATYLIRDHPPTTGRPAEALRGELVAERAAPLVVAADAATWVTRLRRALVRSRLEATQRVNAFLAPSSTAPAPEPGCAGCRMPPG